MSPFWILLELRMMEVVSGDNWSYKTCKAPVRSSPPTNQHPTFVRWMPFLSPNQHSKQWREISHFTDVLPRAHLGVFQTCLVLLERWINWTEAQSGSSCCCHCSVFVTLSSSHLRLIEWLDSRKPFTYNTLYTVSIMQIVVVEKQLLQWLVTVFI